MRLLLGLPILLVVFVAAACDLAPRATTDPTRDQWAAMAPMQKERVAQLRNRMTVVGGRVAALTVPPGIQDAALSQQISELQAQVSTLEGAVSGFEQTVSAVSGEIDAALSKRDKVRARQLVDLAGMRLDQAFSDAGAPFTAIEQRLPAAEAGTSRYLSVIAAEEQRMVRVASEGGELAMAMRWNGANLDLADAATKAGFDRLVKVGGACDALRMTVVTNEAARTDAVTKQLVGAGVPADHVTVGAADRAQAADQLKITVTAACLPTNPTPQPGAGAVNAGAGAPPPPPPGAGAPPPTAVVERVPAGGH
ncbi:MAG TPA: hypothetical protein VM261_23425 [Kofleriaceae bacterium]|nr:hypothetical protein [Kofleriaceae bacterium]